MRNNLFMIRGTLGLAMAASLFLGCQDFLGGEKGGPAVAADADVQHAALAVVSQDSADDMPVQVADTAQPAPTSVTGTLSPEQQVCLDLYGELQTTKDPRYGEVKNLYGSMNCDLVLGDNKPAPPPYVPPTLEERCKLYRLNLNETQPVNDAKWQTYLAEMAILCADYP